MTVAVKPGLQLFRRIAVLNPLRQRGTAAVGAGKIQKMLQPALLAFGEMQIRKARELQAGFLHRGPTVAMDQIERRGEAGTVLAAGAFEQERLWRRIEALDQ